MRSVLQRAHKRLQFLSLAVLNNSCLDLSLLRFTHLFLHDLQSLLILKLLTKPLKLYFSVCFFDLLHREVFSLDFSLSICDQIGPLVALGLGVHHAQKALLREVKKLRLVKENGCILIYCIRALFSISIVQLTHGFAWMPVLNLWNRSLVDINQSLFKILQKLGGIDIWLLIPQVLITQQVSVQLINVMRWFLNLLFKILKFAIQPWINFLPLLRPIPNVVLRDSPQYFILVLHHFHLNRRFLNTKVLIALKNAVETYLGLELRGWNFRHLKWLLLSLWLRRRLYLVALYVVLESGVAVEMLELLWEVWQLLGLAFVWISLWNKRLARSWFEQLLLLLNLFQLYLLLIRNMLENILNPDSLYRRLYRLTHFILYIYWRKVVKIKSE